MPSRKIIIIAAILGLPLILAAILVTSGQSNAVALALGKGGDPAPTLPPPSLPILPTAPPIEAAPKPSSLQLALDYVVATFDADRERLTAVKTGILTLRSLEKVYDIVKLSEKNDENGSRFFIAYVDPETGDVQHNDKSLWEEEAKAHEALYGKMGLELFNVLQPLNDDDLVPVGIWTAGQPGQTAVELQEEAYAQLAATYPEAGQALESSGSPFAVEDEALRAQLNQEFLEIIEAGMAVRRNPVESLLAQEGFAFKRWQSMPLISAALPKWLIVELSRHPDVSAIEYTDHEQTTELDSAAEEHKAPDV